MDDANMKPNKFPADTTKIPVEGAPIECKLINLGMKAEAKCNKGDSLKDVAESQGLGIAFGCESGICATCLIQIRSGKENLSPMTEQEEFTLDARGVDIDSGDVRLGCQCKVMGDVTFEQ